MTTSNKGKELSPTGLSFTVDARVRAMFHAYMYEIAKEHAASAKALDGEDQRKEAKEAMISIMFAYTCLEAYINTVGIDNLGEDWNEFKGTSTWKKWLEIPAELARRKLDKTKEEFSEDEAPLKKNEPLFKSFKELGEIRNTYLVHLKPEFELPTSTKYGTTTDPIFNIFNCETSEWALGIIPDMVRRLDEFLIRPYPIWIK